MLLPYYLSMKKNIIYHRQFQVCAALIAADCCVYSVVDPRQADAAWLIVGYVLLGLTLFSLAFLLAQAFKTYGDSAYKIAWRFLRYGVIATIALVGLQSIGQLTVKDILTLSPLMLVAYFYFGYGKRREVAPVTNK